MKISHQASHQTSLSGKIKKGLADKGITSRSIVAFLVFGMIVLVFVLSDFGGPGGGGSGSMGSAAEVNGEIISLKDFQDEENRLTEYYSQLLGGAFDSELQRNMLRGEVMSALVTKSVSAQAAEKEGIYATDAEVRHMIVEELTYFKKDGLFQSDIYKSLLQANKLTPSEFEGKLRQDIKNQRSRQLFESSLSMSELQKNIEIELRSSKLNLNFIQLSAVEFAKANPVAAAEIAKALANEDFKKKVEEQYKVNQDKANEDKANLNSVKKDIAKKLIADEKYLSFISGIEKDLSAGNSEAVVAQLTKAKLNWQETGYFDIAAEVVPVMNSAQAIKVALSLTNAQPIAKKLVREGDTQFLIKLKDIKTDVGDFKIQDQSVIERQKSMGAYQAWVDSFKKSSRIEVNLSLTGAAK